MPYEPDEVTNPKKTIERRMEEATADPKKGTDAGDLPGSNQNFFKARDRSKDAAGLAKALKSRK